MVRGAGHRQHMHKKELGILTIKHENKLKHENEAEGHGPSASVSCLSLLPHLLVKIPNFFSCMCHHEGYSGVLTIACEKQT